MTHEERLALAIELNKQLAANKVAGRIATRTLITSDQLDQSEIQQLVDIYPKWVSGHAFVINELTAHNGVLYKCVQAHTSQADWPPDLVPALFTAYAPAGVIPDWVQPTGAQDEYNIGDRVRFNGQTYESLIDANVWSPDAYPAGWKLI